ncbi:MAG: dehydrogenase [Acidobacteria bacterium]|nr:dehydrogenase [Acidobacteriota bacterium]
MVRNFEIGLNPSFPYDEMLSYLSPLQKTPSFRCRLLDGNESMLSAKQLQGVDAVIGTRKRITADSLGNVEQLLAIACFGVGYDNVDVQACTEVNVALLHAAGAVNHSVAEAALGWMIALGHHLLRKDRLQREGRWDERSGWMGSEIRRKTVGIIGLGGIGSYLVGLLRPLLVKEVIAYDPLVSSERASSLGVRLVHLNELLESSDYVVISCPLTNETRGLLGPDELALMKRSAYLINVARGGIVDEEALCKMLQSGGIAGAAIDVFAVEPASSQNPLCKLDNVILAPHSIAWTHELFQEIGEMISHQMSSLLAGRVPKGVVNPDVCTKAGFVQKLHRWSEPGI